MYIYIYIYIYIYCTNNDLHTFTFKTALRDYTI